MSNFANVFGRISDVTYTENGGKAFRTTKSDLLDLFANIGGMRKRDEADLVNAWLAARAEDKELADNLVLYARNVRDAGLGERRIGRILLKKLAEIDPTKVKRNLDKIVDTGRWDDLFVFEGTPVEGHVWKFIEAQFRKDVEDMRANKPVSLLAKWMPSINTSSEETKRLARKICVVFSLTPRTYRKTLSALRQYIDVVERKMSAGKWDEINFEGVPSVAMSRYISTFNKRVPEKFKAYKDALVKGEAKVNAATLYPYDITQKFFAGAGGYWGGFKNAKLDPVDEAQWKALPNYVDGEYDVVVLADVSGSMYTNQYQPLATSVGLATYFAQRNKGAYHGMYLTFTDDPHFIKINDSWSLEQTLRYVSVEGMGYNTNLDRAFSAIYQTAKVAGEAPKALVVISDMEIDRWYSGDYCDSIATKWAKKYAEIGLEAPKLILWNVESRGGRVLAQQGENVGFCSGYGVGPFKNLTSLIEKSAYDSMVEILSQEVFTWK